ncbi:aminotransferase [Phascolomyces articulosus]|uniref:Aminotransferase n=1 Tax=Phascolomyces articulosus TaxID=60185 RepID=A0AAD5JWD7_9FUNG|nr:aminotransferase [Phascolomyces articulosus]
MSQDNFALLETILYEPSKGFYLLDRHVDRLLKGVQDFHTQFKTIPTMDQIKTLLKETIPQDDSFKRVRLLFNDKDGLKVEYTDLGKEYRTYETLAEAIQGDNALKVMLDTEAIPCSASDPFITHKTTYRTLYNEARERMGCHHDGKVFDVILWNKQQCITESSIANIAIQTEGGDSWITPSLQCGLLPGVFRDKLLSSDENMIEGVITLNDLINAQKNGNPIVCFNSVRKVYRVQLIILE